MNRLLSQLNRRLAKRGEAVWLQRFAGSGANRPAIRAEVPAIVRALTMEQLIGNISQQNLFIIISPTHLWDHKQWPGGVTPTTQTAGLIDPTDPRLPTTSDSIFCRGPQRAITNVKPVFDMGECIRIEISCLG